MTRDRAAESRLRAELAGLDGMAERSMFGALGFTRHGNLLAGVRQGRLMLRVGKEHEAAALAHPAAEPMQMRGRRMGGYVVLDTDAADDATRETLIGMAVAYGTTLPPKAPKTAKPSPTRRKHTRTTP